MGAFATAVLDSIARRADEPFLVVCDGPTASLGELNRLAEHFTQRAGLAAGSVVLLEFDRSTWPLYVAAYLGCLRAGLVPAMVAADSGTARQEQVLAALDVRLLVVGAGGARDWSGCRWSAVVPTVRRDDAVEAIEYLVTSGTTGTPTVVPVPDEARLATALYTDRARRDGFTALVAPPGSNAAHTVLVDALLVPGAGLAVADRWDPERFLDLVECAGARQVLLAPAMAASLLRTPGFQPSRLSGVHTFRLSMAPASGRLVTELADRLPDTAIVNVYTTTEAWPAGTVMRTGRASVEGVGFPLPGTVVRVVDEDGQDVRPGTRGAIELAYGPRDGYPGHEAVRWVRTGDVGTLSVDGELSVSRRAEDLVTLGGAVVSLAAIEQAMLASGLVRDVAAVTVRTPAGPRIVAAVVWIDRPDAEALRWAILARLGPQAVPGDVVELPEIPRDSQGKLRRSEVAVAVADWRGNASMHTGPDGDPLLDEVRAIWRELLARDDIGRDDDFFAIGGDSLTVVICNSLVEDRLGVELPLACHYEARTLDAFAAAVRAAGADHG